MSANRRLVDALAGVLAVVFAFVASNVAANHEPKPHELPVGLIGSPPAAAALAARLERSAPGSFAVRTYGSRAAARTAILHRTVYGAFEAGPRPTLLVAGAAGPAPELVLRRTFDAVARSRGQPLTVRDLVPLPAADSSGASTFSAMLSLIIAGVVGTSVIFLVTRDRPVPVRLAAVMTLGIGAGLVAALATNVVVGAFSGHFLTVWAVWTLFLLALALPVAAFQVLLGLGGSAVGLVVFLVVGDPSAGGSGPEFLPGFWRAVSQLLPPGAVTTAMRDVVYFHGHGATGELLVLAVYAIAGATGALAANAAGIGAAARKRSHHPTTPELPHAIA
jgi:hypothetical protein